MDKRSPLPPSSVARRMACPGSRALEAKYPKDEESPGAREGKAAHYVAHWYLSYINKVIGSHAPNGELITQEMKDAAFQYYVSVYEVTQNPADLHLEQHLDISTIHPECFGRPDCWAFVKGQLHIWDYKFGHSPVEVFENWQLIEYAAGILELLKINGLQDQHVRVSFYIVQPRSFHKDGPVRKWSVMASELRGHFNALRNMEALSMGPEPECKPNPMCNHCLGRSFCPALQRSSLSAVDLSMSNTPWELKPTEIGNELRYLKRAAELLNARITGLSEEALAHLKRGERIPHFKIEESAGRERWKVSNDEIATLGEMLGHDLKKPVDVITPKQAMKAGVPVELVQAYSEIQRGSLKLVTDDGSNSRKVFGGQ